MTPEINLGIQLGIDARRIRKDISTFADMQAIAAKEETTIFAALTTKQHPFLLIQVGFITNTTFLISSHEQLEKLIAARTSDAKFPVPPELALAKVTAIDAQEAAGFRRIAAKVTK